MGETIVDTLMQELQKVKLTTHISQAHSMTYQNEVM